MKSILLAFCLIATSAVHNVSAEEWTPPQDPSPQAILNEARDDFRAGDFVTANSKYVWFYEHALEHDEGMGGVRLSFAMSDWYKLAQDYKPAKTDMYTKRDEAAEKALNAEDPFPPMHDLSAFNRTFGEDEHTRDIFLMLEKKDAKRAKRAHFAVRDVMLRLEDFETLGRIIGDPEEELDRLTYTYRQTRRMAKKSANSSPLNDAAEQQLFRGTTALLVTLVKNNRQEEAKVLAEAVRKESDNSEFQAAVDDALNGKLREPPRLQPRPPRLPIMIPQ